MQQILLAAPQLKSCHAHWAGKHNRGAANYIILLYIRNIECSLQTATAHLETTSQPAIFLLSGNDVTSRILTSGKDVTNWILP